MISYFYWILMTWYFFTCIVVIYYFIIDTNTWLYISFPVISEFLKCTFGVNVDSRKVWISYNSIPVGCFWIIFSLLLKRELKVIHLLFLDLNKSFLPIFPLEDVNTITIHFTSIKYCHGPIKIKLEIWEYFQCHEHWASIYCVIYMTIDWTVFIKQLVFCYT